MTIASVLHRCRRTPRPAGRPGALLRLHHHHRALSKTGEAPSCLCCVCVCVRPSVHPAVAGTPALETKPHLPFFQGNSEPDGGPAWVSPWSLWGGPEAGGLLALSTKPPGLPRGVRASGRASQSGPCGSALDSGGSLLTLWCFLGAPREEGVAGLRDAGGQWLQAQP